MSYQFGYKREAVRVKVTKLDSNGDGVGPEQKKFSVDPQITSHEVLLSLLAKAFDIKGCFAVSYRVLDEYDNEAYIPMLSDWDLDAAFLSASDPYLCLKIDLKPYEATVCEIEEEPAVESKPLQGLQGLIMNHVEKTFNMVQRALNLTEEAQPATSDTIPPRTPLTDIEFRNMLDPIGQLVQASQLRSAIYYGGVEPSLRKVVWKHLLNVYPDGMSGKERMDYMKSKCQEYLRLRDTWRDMLKHGHMVGDLGYVTSMVRKDVLRTDRHLSFYAGSDDNKNIASLFNILTTFALNHPSVSYCQGMSDLASPLLVTMQDEAHAYICFCALMRRLSPNFHLDGINMTQRFQHLADGLQYYDTPFYNYLKSHQADDLLFCYRWLLLEMKREFAFEDALRMLEVMWSSLPPDPPEKGLLLFEQEFVRSPSLPSPRPKENAYTKVCALRRGINHSSLDETKRSSLVKAKPFTSLDENALKKAEGRVVKNLKEFFTLDKGGPRSQDSSPEDDSSEWDAMTTSVTRELRMELESLDRSVLSEEPAKDGAGDEGAYVWENPLRDESVEGTEQNKGEPGKKAESSLLERRQVVLEEIPSWSVSAPAQPSQLKPSRPGFLPPPHEFGGGNPFLMFLCITVLRQHRDLVMRNSMDYNEMAIHFDKMVRKHNVTKVLNQARQMYAAYLTEHSAQLHKNLSV